MSRYVHTGDTEAREPLLTGDYLETHEPNSDEGEIIFERITSNITHDAAAGTQRRLTYEEAVEEAGFGVFHWLLLVVCGWANASDAVEILCVSFLLPTARCDLSLSSSDMGLLTASIFLGMMVGGYLWGYLADQRGRCRVLVVSLTINGVFGGLASLAPWFWLFLLMRFISGIGVGGSIPVIFSYFSEFMPRLRRGAMISALATFWMAGNILAAGLAWMVIPRTWIHFSLGSLNLQSWRVFVMLCSVPSLTSALIFRLLMPESPKFLMEAGREKEAIHVFKVMFELNMRGKGKDFPKFGLCTSSKPRGKTDETRTRGSQRGRLAHILIQGLVPVKQMFKGPLRSRSLVLLVIFYCISFGFYGLWMWFPELFERMESGGGSPCANVSLPSSHYNQSCYPVKTAVYMEGFVIAASNLPGNIFTILMMDHTGGKALLSGSLLLSSLTVFLIYVIQTKVQSLVLSCVFSSVSVITWNALDVVGTELYPTQLRSSALGFFTGVGRVAAITGNVVFGKLVDTNCAVPVLMVSALLLTGGLVALLLPQTKQTELT
ncbi:synaptic vesicle glycoprotein 2C isoform X1 [Acanthopagrus latus]|uniref:synaptic vesicle glycoprotein 2C isoform X1 n=2 Tax=Acanthopagrus latus TaxID=8177 RepID=UPI00187C2F71|nr:synaptic vesicle glycoprotein 2C isoform X1 [Acanthopagrus latus]XP_036963069.1 synaptic vesicle glycoprotein 2C isoform X1 [Acanthopagrus latus]XP_036963070.1 synaptic vesicle glycoprotein 2C isoform X1 [Acanthopagrus latus]XP_036963071.1 synaptic vesicle glycoprotein 2C isoform X1 [Acanthopagrus latus]